MTTAKCRTIGGDGMVGSLIFSHNYVYFIAIIVTKQYTKIDTLDKENI